MENINLKFESVSEFIKYCDDKKLTCAGRNWCGYDPEFYGTKDFDEAAGLLASGCVDIVKKFEMNLKTGPREAGFRGRPVLSVVGGAACVPAALAGLPLSMIDRQRTPAKDKIVNIYYNCAYCSRIKTDQIINVGSYVLRLCERLEASGHRVNMYAGGASRVAVGENAGAKFQMLINVKRAGDRLNLAKLSYCFAHPSFMRRHRFLCMESNGFNAYTTSPAPLDPSFCMSGAIIINGADYVRDPSQILSLFNVPGRK